MSPLEAASLVEDTRRSLTVLYETPAAVEMWLNLAKTREVRGVRTHDAYLLCVASVNAAELFVTLNTKDFQSLNVEGIAIETPFDEE